jgi:putative oxidoreductase
MFSFLDKFKSYQGELLGLMRILAGLLALAHGTRILFDFPMKFPFPMNNLLTTAGVIETVCGALIVVGFMTRPAAFLLSGFMAVAYFMNHFPKSIYPIANGGELGVALCFVFLYLVAAGSGKFSVDGGK